MAYRYAVRAQKGISEMRSPLFPFRTLSFSSWLNTISYVKICSKINSTMLYPVMYPCQTPTRISTKNLVTTKSNVHSLGKYLSETCLCFALCLALKNPFINVKKFNININPCGVSVNRSAESFLVSHLADLFHN